MSEEITTLELGFNSLYDYRLHPSVPLTILELYYRRKTKSIAGTLLGIIYPNRIDITNCYAVPLLTNEDETNKMNIELGIDKDYHKKMLELNQKIYPKEVVVGFFFTQSELSHEIAILNSFYFSKDSNFTSQGVFQAPVILTLDPELKNGTFDLKGYINAPLTLCKDSYIMFQNVNLKMEFFEENVHEISSLLRDQDLNEKQVKEFSFSRFENLETVLETTISNLKYLQEYLKTCKDKNMENFDQSIGKALKKLLNLTPIFTQKEFSSTLSKEMQDVLLIMYLTNMANVQASISEKLNKL